MRVFRIDAFLDVVLGGVVILLVFLLVSRPATIDTGYHRQADFAIGCFADETSGAWDGTVTLYARDAQTGSDAGTEWRIVATDGRITTVIDLLDPLLVTLGTYSRAVIFVDVAGAACAHHRQSPLRRALNRRTRARDWTIAQEYVPCESRTACESLMGLGQGADAVPGAGVGAVSE